MINELVMKDGLFAISVVRNKLNKPLKFKRILITGSRHLKTP